MRGRQRWQPEPGLILWKNNYLQIYQKLSGKLQTLITAAAAGVGGTGGGSGSGEVVALVEVEVLVLVEALALAVAVETRRYLNNGSWTPLVSTNFTVTSPFLFCNPGETDVMNSRN